MAHATLKMAPGVNKNRTPALNEVSLSDTNLVRFMPDREGLGLVQKIGGWKKFYASQFHTPIRAMWAWEDTNGKSHLGVGAETDSVKIYKGSSNGAQAIFYYNGPNIFATGSQIVVRNFVPDGYNGVYTVRRSEPGKLIFDCPETDEVDVFGTISTGGALSVITDNSRIFITPGFIESQLPPRFSTKKGSPIVTVEDASAVYYEGDTVFLKTQVSVGGVVLFGSYVIGNVRSGKYDIISRNAIGAANPATSDVTSGGVLPVFEFTQDSAYVLVTLPNHGLNDGDTFTILDPVEAGNVRLYGNFIVLLRNVNDKTNQFQITAPSAMTAGSLYAYPTKTTSTGVQVNGTLQYEIGLIRGDKVTWTGLTPNYDGVFPVNQSKDTTFIIADTRNWNAMTALGRMFKSNGAAGGKYAVCYSEPYRINLGDRITLSGVAPAAYNGDFDVIDYADNRATIATSATGDITNPGTVFLKRSTQNAGLAYFVYSRSAAGQPITSGYGVGGYGIGGYGVGETAPNPKKDPVPIIANEWTLDNWGDTLIACPVGGAIYQWNPVSNESTASILPNAPVANDGIFVSMPQRQIVAWGSTFTGIQDPLLIRWCDVSNYGVWAGTVTNQAGSYRIAKGSKIVACIQGPQQGLIWTDLALWSMQYVGLPLVYSFNEIGTGCGLIGRKAAGSINGAIYWMGQSQFFALGNGGPTPIPCPVWDSVFQDLDTAHVDKIRFAANSNFNEVMWFYPTVGSGGVNTNYVKLNIQMGCWDYGTLGRTAWINQSVFGPPIGAGEDRFIYQHEVGEDADQLPMNSFFQTGYAQLGEGEYKIFVDQIWPDFKWGLFDGRQDADLKLTFYVADYPGDEPRVYGPYDMNRQKEFITPRFRGRLVSIRVESNDAASFWRIGAMRYRFSADGKF